MKRFLVLISMIILPFFISAQVSITADSNYIKIEKAGMVIPVLFTKDVKFGYDGTYFYFSDKLSGPAWEYTVKYTDITKYNSFVKNAAGIPTYNTIRDALITFIKKGKASGGSGSGGTTNGNLEVTQEKVWNYLHATDSLFWTRIWHYQHITDSLMTTRLYYYFHYTDSLAQARILAQDTLKNRVTRLYAEVVKTTAVTPYTANMIFGDTTHQIVLAGAARCVGRGGWIEGVDIATNNTTWLGAVVTAVIYDSIVPLAYDHHLYTKQYTTKQKRHKVSEVPVTMKSWSTTPSTFGGVTDSSPDCVGGYVAMGTLGNARYRCEVGTNLYVVLIVTTPAGTSVSGQRMSIILTLTED